MFRVPTRAVLGYAERAAGAADSLLGLAPQTIRTFVQLQELATNLNAAMPGMERAFDQVETLATTMNAAMPGVVEAFAEIDSFAVTMNEKVLPQMLPILDQTQPLVENMNAAMPRVGPTLDETVTLAQSMNGGLDHVGSLLSRTTALLETVVTLAEELQTKYTDGLPGRTEKAVAKAWTAPSDLRERGPQFLRRHDQDTASASPNEPAADPVRKS